MHNDREQVVHPPAPTTRKGTANRENHDDPTQWRDSGGR